MSIRDRLASAVDWAFDVFAPGVALERRAARKASEQFSQAFRGAQANRLTNNWQCGGQGFEPPQVHHSKTLTSSSLAAAWGFSMVLIPPSQCCPRRMMYQFLADPGETSGVDCTRNANWSLCPPTLMRACWLFRSDGKPRIVRWLYCRNSSGDLQHQTRSRHG